MTHVCIRGLRKEAILAALYNAGRLSQIERAAADTKQHLPLRDAMTIEEAARLTAEAGLSFDHHCGVKLKVDLSGVVVDACGYDTHHGEGALAEVIRVLRKSKDVNLPGLRLRTKPEHSA
jgi:hypothetical protein